MSAFRPVHPLDVDLADLVDGRLDDERAAEVEAHVAGCRLCRIKRHRLRDAPPGGEVTPVDLTFPVPAAGAGAPEAGDLWVTTGDERLLVLVLRTLDDRLLVAPVTFDIEAADDGTVVVDAARSPLQTELAVYPSLATELPRAVLADRLGFVGVVGPDGTTGAAIAGPSDPRLEVRQLLADRLAALDEQRPDPATAADAPPPGPHQVRSSLIADLRDLRGDTCAVRPLDHWGDVLVAHQAGWTPLATVDEVGVVLVVLDTPHGLADDADFHAARAVLTRFNATALVVLATAITELADVFDSPSLNYGIEAPSGARTPPRPLISGLTPFDAVGKFLDQTTGARATAAPSRGPIARVDVGAILRDAASAALADAVRQASRFKIAPKRRGYESVSDAEARFHAALEQALGGEPGVVAQALVELAVEREGER